MKIGKFYLDFSRVEGERNEINFSFYPYRFDYKIYRRRLSFYRTCRYFNIIKIIIIFSSRKFSSLTIYCWVLATQLTTSFGCRSSSSSVKIKKKNKKWKKNNRNHIYTVYTLRKTRYFFQRYSGIYHVTNSNVSLFARNIRSSLSKFSA